jgi:hypothetical protein
MMIIGTEIFFSDPFRACRMFSVSSAESGFIIRRDAKDLALVKSAKEK